MIRKSFPGHTECRRFRRHPTARWIGRISILLALVPLTACATKRDVRDVREEIRELHAQTQAMLRDIQLSERAQQDSIRQLARNLQEYRAETSRRLVSIGDQLLTVQELTGLSQQQLAGLRDEMERDRARALGGGGPGGFDPMAGDADPGGAGEIYQASLNALNRGQLGTARRGFEQVVEQFGGDALAPEARYYLADILYQEGERESAIEAFLEIPEFHPTAQRVPDALYRVGTIYNELGDVAAAEEYFERVVNTYPDTGAADLARDELERLE
ncbi:MAG: tetratricopeptide repeat protein [Gemmatimonadota bacterium]